MITPSRYDAASNAATFTPQSLTDIARSVQNSSNVTLQIRTMPSAVAHRPLPAPSYAVMPAWTGFVVQPQLIVLPGRGYDPGTPPIPPTLLPSDTAPAVAKTATSTKTSTSRELAFLDDKSLSIEEKLFRFMSLMVKKSDQQLVDEMKKAYSQSPSSSSSSSSSKSSGSSTPSFLNGILPGSSPNGILPGSSPAQSSGGGGLFGFLGDALGGALGGVGDLLGVGGSGSSPFGALESVAKELGGPLLAGVASVFGFPELAPIALQYGGDLSAGLVHGIGSLVEGAGGSSRSSPAGTNANGGLVAPFTGFYSASNESAAPFTGFDDVSSESVAASTPKTATSTSSSSSSASDTTTDEKLQMMNLQRLVEKQNAMFSALSNVLKSINDARMTAVQNIR